MKQFEIPALKPGVHVTIYAGTDLELTDVTSAVCNEKQQCSILNNNVELEYGEVNERDAIVTIKCAANYGCSDSPTITCSPCPIGYMSIGGHAKCVSCQEGTFLGSNGECIPCPAGKYSTAGATECLLEKVYILSKTDQSAVSSYENPAKYKVMNPGAYTQFSNTFDEKSIVAIFIDTFTSGLSIDVSKLNKQIFRIISTSSIKTLEAKKLTFDKTSILTAKSDKKTQLQGANSGDVELSQEYNKHVIASFDDVLTIKQDEGAEITETIALAPTKEDAQIFLDGSVDVKKQKFTISSDSSVKTLTVFVGDKKVSDDELKAFIDTTGSEVKLSQEQGTPRTIKKGLSGGAIAGIVIGCVVFAAAIIVVILILKKKKKNSEVEPQA